MFLDPDPKRQKTGMSGFFSSQRPIESPRDHRTTIRRKAQPLHERSQSQNNQQQPNPAQSPDKPTVRLVKASPPQLAQENSSSHDDEHKTSDKEKENRQDLSGLFVKPASVANPGLPGFAASSQDKSVSDLHNIPNEAQSYTHPDHHSLLSTNPVHATAVPRKEWHRRSGSTGNYSTSSTLKESEASFFGQKSVGGDSRLSQGTTLRGTPTPYEQDNRERVEAEEEPTLRQPSHASGSALSSLSEAPERSTVRVVQPSKGSDSSDHPLRSETSESSLVVRPQTSPRSGSDSDQRPTFSRRSSRRGSSASSLPEPLNIRQAGGSQTPRNQSSQESIAASENTIPAASSPNFVTYQQDSSRPPSRPRSGTHPLHYSYSIESIDSRIQYPTLQRPETGHSLAATSSWASLPPSSSTDTLPPLQVPKKRLRHKPASLSLNQAARSGMASYSAMAQDEIDTLPYPREQFSSHLSTIASESAGSRTTSQQLSHFSLGGGVLTGDDSSSLPLSGTWPRRRRESAPINSVASEVSRGAPGSSSEEEPGDMTLGVFREASAKPQPLFQPRAQHSPGLNRPYEGPFPPLPPIPKSRDSSENFDKVSELHTPRLREKRSGYSLRRRSNSTPSRRISTVSRNESDRWSQASSIFPYWAKQFYGHGATLMSASKVSLSTPGQSRNGPPGHIRNESSWTERSITSRLGTGYSEIEESSPTSSHFLPSIFRPRTRNRSKSEGNRKSAKLQKSRSRRRRPSVSDEPRSDSMGIYQDPLPEGQPGDAEYLPSGQPKYGTLRDGSEQPRPLPRKYSKQRKWNEMTFPRPMTKDRLSDFGIHNPHLAPTNRHSNRLSMWRAPSFVESLDTLWRSRCNRQILLFALGFIFPPFWMLGAMLPIPKKPLTAAEYEKQRAAMGEPGMSEEDLQTAMMKHEAGDAEKRWREEKAWLKGRWWRWLNRVMSVIGVLVVAAVVSILLIPFLSFRITG